MAEPPFVAFWHLYERLLCAMSSHSTGIRDDLAPELRWTFLRPKSGPFVRRGPLRRLAQYAALRGNHQTKAATRNCSPTGYLKMVSTAFGTAWFTATMLK